MGKSISNLEQLKENQQTDFQNKIIQVVYQLFNSFSFNKEFVPIFSKKKKKKINEESVSDAYDIDTTDIPDLENEKSAAK